MNALVKNLLLTIILGPVFLAVVIVGYLLLNSNISDLEAEKWGRLVGGMLTLPLIGLGLLLGLWARKRMGLAPLKFTPLNVTAGVVIGLSIAAAIIVFSPKEASSLLDDEHPWAKAGKNRDAFIRGAVRSCVKTQRALPENKDASDALIDSVCTCHANTMADTTTRQEAKYVEEHRGPSADAAKKAQASFDSCVQAQQEKPAAR